jgi:hypothetical protein
MSKGDQNSTVGKLQIRSEINDPAVADLVDCRDGRKALPALEAKLDAELAVLRTPDAANRLRKLFEASSADFAAAANAAAKRSKR